MKPRRERSSLGSFRAGRDVWVRRVRWIGIQPVASLWEGFHDHVLVVPQSAANIGNALSEAVVGHEGIGPNRLHQRILGHDLARSRREHGEHLGGLTAKVNRFAFDRSELFAVRQEDKTAERDRFGRFRVNFRSLSGHFTLLARLLA